MLSWHYWIVFIVKVHLLKTRECVRARTGTAIAVSTQTATNKLYFTKSYRSIWNFLSQYL